MFFRMSVGRWEDVLFFVNAVRRAYVVGGKYRSTITEQEYQRLCAAVQSFDKPDSRILFEELRPLIIAPEVTEEGFISSPIKDKHVFSVGMGFFHRVDIRFCEEEDRWVQFWVNSGQFDFKREAKYYVAFLLDLALEYRCSPSKMVEVSSLDVTHSRQGVDKTVFTAIDPKVEHGVPATVGIELFDYVTDILAIVRTGYRKELGLGELRTQLPV